MNTVVKYFTISLALNALSFFLLFSPILFYDFDLSWGLLSFLFIGISLFVQLVIGFTFIITEHKKQIGKAMLLSVGLLIVAALLIKYL